MPLLITHLAYLQKYWQQNNLPQPYLADALAGTVLPDIRYLVKIKRTETHTFTAEQLDKKILTDNNSDPNKLSNFKAGFLFHLQLDQWWPRQYNFVTDYQYFGLALKIATDLILKPKIKNLSTLKPNYQINFLATNRADINSWYEFIEEYLIASDCQSELKKLLQKNLFYQQEIPNLWEQVEKILQNKNIILALQKTYTDFVWKRL